MTNLTIIVFDDKLKAVLQSLEVNLKGRVHLLDADMIEIGGDNINSVQADMRAFLNNSSDQLTLIPNRSFNKPDYFAFGVAFCADVQEKG